MSMPQGLPLPEMAVMLTVAAGKSIAAPITETYNGSSTINYAGSTTISYDVGSSGSEFAYVNFDGGTVNPWR